MVKNFHSFAALAQEIFNTRREIVCLRVAMSYSLYDLSKVSLVRNGPFSFWGRGERGWAITKEIPAQEKNRKKNHAEWAKEKKMDICKSPKKILAQPKEGNNS